MQMAWLPVCSRVKYPATACRSWQIREQMPHSMQEDSSRMIDGSSGSIGTRIVVDLCCIRNFTCLYDGRCFFYCFCFALLRWWNDFRNWSWFWIFGDTFFCNFPLLLNNNTSDYDFVNSKKGNNTFFFNTWKKAVNFLRKVFVMRSLKHDCLNEILLTRLRIKNYDI